MLVAVLRCNVQALIFGVECLYSILPPSRRRNVLLIIYDPCDVRQDGDWDGKAVRLVHFFVRGMVTVQGDTEGRMLGSHWEGRGITPAQIMQAVECFR